MATGSLHTFRHCRRAICDVMRCSLNQHAGCGGRRSRCAMHRQDQAAAAQAEEPHAAHAHAQFHTCVASVFFVPSRYMWPELVHIKEWPRGRTGKAPCRKSPKTSRAGHFSAEGGPQSLASADDLCSGLLKSRYELEPAFEQKLFALGVSGHGAAQAASLLRRVQRGGGVSRWLQIRLGEEDSRHLLPGQASSWSKDCIHETAGVEARAQPYLRSFGLLHVGYAELQRCSGRILEDLAEEQPRLGGTSLKAASLLSTLRALVPEARGPVFAYSQTRSGTNFEGFGFAV